MSGGEAIGLTRRCVPDLWLDGMPAPKDFEFNHLVSGYDIYALEVYTRAVQVPAEFQSMSGCGAIIVWTGVRKSIKR